jgi:Flp pilus assembly pilin Flp
MLNSSRLSNFAHNESGAVTVDWVVLTAAMVGLGIGATLTVIGAWLISAKTSPTR